MGSLPAAGVRETPRLLFPTHSYHSTLTSTARETTRGVHTVSQRNDVVGFRCWSLSAGPRRLVLAVSITDRPYPMFALSPSRIIRSTGFCPLSRLVCSFRHSVASWSLLSSSNLLTCRPCDPPRIFPPPLLRTYLLRGTDSSVDKRVHDTTFWLPHNGSATASPCIMVCRQLIRAIPVY